MPDARIIFRRIFKLTSACGGCAALAFTFKNLATPAFASSELKMHVPSLDWTHDHWLKTFDHASIRRGFQVYRQVCSACHGMKFVCFRHLTGVCLTEAETKEIAAEYMFKDGPDESGQMFERPGKPSDAIPSPYANDNLARAANNGALPPDFSYIAKARHGLENYIFYLLTSYCDPPAGIELQPNQYYNPYFPGGALGMTPPLYNEIIEYEDGTPATVSQMAKDVATFLSFAADPHRDQRELLVLKSVFIGVAFFAITLFWKRKIWSPIKAQKVVFKDREIPKL